MVGCNVMFDEYACKIYFSLGADFGTEHKLALGGVQWGRAKQANSSCSSEVEEHIGGFELALCLALTLA